MKLKLLLASAIPMLIATQAANNQSLLSSVPSDSEIRKILANRVDRFPPGVGIVVGVVIPQGRRIVSYGSLAKNDPRPLTGDTLFEIGSITKVFTSLLLADMIQRGEVALADPVAKYLPQEVKVPERGGRQITLRDLATHTSSLPRDAPVKPGAGSYAQYSPAQLYEFLAGYKLPRDIGSKWEYSNLGVGLLGYVLALREDSDLETLFSERITGPLGMNGTHFTLTPELRTRLAVGHLFMGPPAPDTEIGGPWAGMGGLKSSANDMLTFLSAFMGSPNTPVASAMASMLNVRVPGPDGREQALGWEIGWPWRHAGRPEKTIVSHEGATVGFRAFAGYNPESRVGVVVLTNHRAILPLDIGSYLLDQRFTLLRDKDLVPPKQIVEIAIDPRLLDQYAGQYEFPEGKATVTREGDHLVVTDKDFGPMPFYAESTRDFFSKIEDSQISFQTDGQGRVFGFIFHPNGKTKHVKRID